MNIHVVHDSRIYLKTKSIFDMNGNDINPSYTTTLPSAFLECSTMPLPLIRRASRFRAVMYLFSLDAHGLGWANCGHQKIN